MLKILLSILTIFGALFFAPFVYAGSSSFVSVVNPVRGSDFWDQKQEPVEAVKGQIAILKDKGISATWLLRYDALKEQKIRNEFINNNQNNEKGLFLEVTPTWAAGGKVPYRKSSVWHQAGSAFLSGYSQKEREQLIDTAFEYFKNTFGFYPKSVGAWWIDSYSLNYMQNKYGIIGALIVADQYTTDNYQIWGQYWATPYYPSKRDALIPAQSLENKIPVVIMQWAVRDPVNGYGDGVQESTYSVQANDYIDYHNLNINYFSKLVDIYTSQEFNKFGHIVVGLENSYSWNRYKEEYQKQMEILAEKRNSGQVKLATMTDFARWYQSNFPKISPEHIIVADNPLGGEYKAVWFMNPYYRAAWFYNKDGAVFRDIRQYIEGETEPCFDKPCDKINFATFSTRVLDDVTYHQRLSLDQGRIKDIKVEKLGENYDLTYKNESDREKKIIFMPRDISIDGNVKTIDGLILDIQTQAKKIAVENQPLSQKKIGSFRETTFGFLLKLIQFVLFTIAALFIPGFLFVKFLKQESFIFNFFISICSGLVLFTLISFIFGFLKIPFLEFIYLFIPVSIFIYKKSYKQVNLNIMNFGLMKRIWLFFVLIILGTFFQSLAVVRSGWIYNFGMGFWGPTGHDGIWHQALINQLLKNIPPQNPAFSGQFLTNYHYFFDLLIATSSRLSFVPVIDLLYRFYPVFFSFLLGVGTYLLITRVFSESRYQKIPVVFSLFFVYFGGSFGWVVDFLKGREWGGESAFWVNQPVSMNLNPPFAISLVLIIAVILIFQVFRIQRSWPSALLLVLFVGALPEFKIYGGIIVYGGFLLVSLKELIKNKDFWFMKIFLFSLLLTGIIFFPQGLKSGNLLIFSPFWFIHSMIDFSDRVGWERLAQARAAYLSRGDWLKFILAEGLALAVFIIGNIGTRILSFFAGGVLIKKRFWQSLDSNFIFTMVLIAFIIPIFFVQKGNNWNTIQFFYYVLYFLSLSMGIFLANLYKRVLKQPVFFKIFGLSFIGLILFITPISVGATFKDGFYNIPPSRLTFGELEALTFMKNLPDGIVLTYPFDKNLRANFKNPFPLYTYETTSYISAFSAKSTFIEDEIQQEILQGDYKKRLVLANDFFNSGDYLWMNSFLEENKIKYIYLLKTFHLPVESDKLNIKQVFENSEVKIFQVLN